MDSLIDILQWSLPTGFLSSLVTWIVSRRKQNNDMLSQLQASINMLSTENRKILDENIILRKENAELKVNQEETNMRISQLVKEVERLRKLLTRRQTKDEKQNKVVDTAANVSNVRIANKLRHTKTDTAASIHTDRDDINTRLNEIQTRFLKNESSTVTNSAQGDIDCGPGDDPLIGGEGGALDREPP